MKKITLLVVNSVTLVFALVMNGLAGTSVFNGKSVGAVSAKYNTLIAPAGYAFAIWGIIYLMLIMFIGYQWYAYYKKRNDDKIKQTGLWFSIANLANGLWIIAWLNAALFISVLLILLLLISLVVLTVKLRLEIPDTSKRIVTFVWWPIAVYLGWIIVASVSNIAVYLVSIGWNGGFLTERSWTIIMISIATIIYIWLVLSRNLRETAVVGIWAFIAIAIRHWGSYEGIAYAAIAAAGILLVSILYNAYKNRHHLTFSPETRMD